MTELTERYLGATLRSVPEKQRADIEAELRASIADAIDARVADGEDSKTAEKAVLSELGHPDRLAAGYAGRPGYLIGPDLFYDYKQLLGVLLITVVPIVAVVVGTIDALAGEGVVSVLGGTASLIVTLVVHIAFWTTLMFAIMEWTGEKSPTGKWTPSMLPPLTPTTGRIKLGETIGSVVILVIVIAGLSLSSEHIGIISDEGVFVSVFDPAMWDFWIPFLIGLLAVEIVFELIKYRVGRWTWTLASVNVAMNVAFALPAIYLLATDRLLNPDFFVELNGGEWIGNVGTITVIVIAAIAVWDVIDGFRKTRKAT